LKNQNVPSSEYVKTGELCDRRRKDRREDGGQSTDTNDPWSRKTGKLNDGKGEEKREEGRQGRYVNDR
jgi:hypothetical protein